MGGDRKLQAFAAFENRHSTICNFLRTREEASVNDRELAHFKLDFVGLE